MEPTPHAPPPLELRGVGRSYGATRALDGVSLRFEAGRVHALVGRNGAGKSTLVRILAGAVAPGEGELLVDGAPVRLRSPADALARGIATVHQELSLASELTVAENVLLGRFPRRRLVPLLDRPELERRARAVLDGLGCPLDPRARVGSLSFAERQVVEIARAVSRAPRALLLDEPTSALSRAEADALVRVTRSLAGRGVAIVYVTHRLDELPRVADVVSALRDGRHAGTIDARDATPARLVELMFGDEDVAPRRRGGTRPAGPPVLEARGLAVEPRLHDASLALLPGEVLGLAGLQGSGRTELLLALFGAARATRGEVLVDGRRVEARSPRALVRRGLALVPEDRKSEGLALDLPIRDNASLPSLRRLARGGLLRRAAQLAAVAPVLAGLRLAAPSLEHPVSALSGGNQQKVVAGKWLLEPRRVLLLDEPTKGIDLHARRDLFDAVRRLASEGVGVILVSSELEELLQECDRILVLREGRVAGEVRPGEVTLEGLLGKAMGA